MQVCAKVETCQNIDEYPSESYLASQVSFVVRDAEEKRHKRGVNALQLDHNNGRLFSCGRDAIVSHKIISSSTSGCPKS